MSHTDPSQLRWCAISMTTHTQDAGKTRSLVWRSKRDTVHVERATYEQAPILMRDGYTGYNFAYLTNRRSAATAVCFAVVVADNYSFSGQRQRREISLS